MNNPSQTSRQAIYVALQTVSTSSQTINRNVLGVVANEAATASNSEPGTDAVRVAKSPLKKSATQQPSSDP